MSEKTILLIEDDTKLHGPLQQRLREVFPNHQVKIVTNAYDAAAAAAELSVVAVITDNLLPRSDSDRSLEPHALKLCSHIRRRVPHLKDAPLYVFSNSVIPDHQKELERMDVFVVDGKTLQDFEIIVEHARRKIPPAHLPADHRQSGVEGAAR